MKKVVFAIVGSMLISLGAAQAQQRSDTTGTAKSNSRYGQQDQSQQSTDQSKNGQTDRNWQQQSDRNQSQYSSQQMVEVKQSELPSSLKQQLQSNKSKYAGWENATIYMNKTSGHYVIVPKPYSFDKQGKEVEMDNSNWYYYGNRYGNPGDQQSGQYQSGQSGQNQRSGQYQSGQNDQYQSGQQNQRSGQYQSGQNQDQSSSGQYQSGQNTDTNGTSTQAERQMGEIPTSASQDQTDDDDVKNQEDATSSQRTNEQSSSYRADKSKTDTRGQYGQTESQYNTENMEEVEASSAPASLRRTLRESQYSGWEEKGKLYKDPSTNEYVLVMEVDDASSSSAGQNSSASAQGRSYRFDKNGKLMNDQSSTTQQRKR